MYLKKEMERFGEVEAGFGAGRLIMLMISQNDTSLHHIAPTTTSGAGLLSYSSLAPGGLPHGQSRQTRRRTSLCSWQS
jgi:hypothetical protein